MLGEDHADAERGEGGESRFRPADKACVRRGLRRQERVAGDDDAEQAGWHGLFELFVQTGSGTETARRLHAESVAAKSGRPLEKGDVYKFLKLRTYIGEVEHKGRVFPGQHQAIAVTGSMRRRC